MPPLLLPELDDEPELDELDEDDDELELDDEDELLDPPLLVVEVLVIMPLEVEVDPPLVELELPPLEVLVEPPLVVEVTTMLPPLLLDPPKNPPKKPPKPPKPPEPPTITGGLPPPVAMTCACGCGGSGSSGTGTIAYSSSCWRGITRRMRRTSRCTTRRASVRPGPRGGLGDLGRLVIDLGACLLGDMHRAAAKDGRSGGCRGEFC